VASRVGEFERSPARRLECAHRRAKSREHFSDAHEKGEPAVSETAPLSDAGIRMPKIIRDVDILVGIRVRLRRREAGLSQGALGEKLGVSFQQVQKYENGGDRISAGVLYELSKALSVPITYFFEGCETRSKARGRKRG
jgi:ribosome-binding protein aMBF1 (putative translation factor)